MADRNNMEQYSYAAMANLVQTADRRYVTRRDNEPTGEPESLAGKIDPKDFGTRASLQTRDRPLSLSSVQPVELRGEEDILKLVTQKRKRKDNRRRGPTNVIDATDQIEGLMYRPKTKETKQTYEILLSLIDRLLPDQPSDVIRSAGDEIVAILKNPAMKDFDKKKDIESTLAIQLDNETFSNLLKLVKKLNDYGDDVKENEGMDVDSEEKLTRNEEIEERLGVAVVFGDEEDEEGDRESRYLRGISSGLSDEEDESDVDENAEAVGSAVDDEEKTIVGEKLSVQKLKKGDQDKLSVHEVDAFYLLRLVATAYPDPLTAQQKAIDTFSLLESNKNLIQVENELMELFEFERFDLVRICVKNRDVIVWCTKISRAETNEDRAYIEAEMQSRGFSWILNEFKGERTVQIAAKNAEISTEEMPPETELVQQKPTTQPHRITITPKRIVDLDSLIFEEGPRLMANKKVILPPGCSQQVKKGYEEIHVPAPKTAILQSGEKLVPISALPSWAQPAFTGTASLNRIQSRLYPIAFPPPDIEERNENILLCAPTGAGKTNVAMLTILNELSKHRDENTGEINLDEFKIVYIAPLKALVQEMVGNFKEKLKSYGIRVSELTGDHQLTKQQVSETQIIVTTPEKWDVITRKASDTTYVTLVRLIIIDEIHLLHDNRGPVIESIVSRTIRRQEQTGETVRLIGLSATLPNYQDVAAFLRVNPTQGIFYFDGSYRPCPLRQEFIGITEKKAIKRVQTMNDVTYEKILQQMGKNQVLVFVHSRKETSITAKAIRDKAMEEKTIGGFVRSDVAVQEIIRNEVEQAKDTNLRDILPYGIAIHHAGMSRLDREISESLFANGHVQVLVSTATLAWGVNLPAHTVIIKGTTIYSPEKGNWVELSPQDVLQMLGRAGRPQYDTYGEGIIITTQDQIQYYLSLMNAQLPIESQFMKKLADNMNAEIVLGTIRNRDEAIEWLGYTYLYIRMLRSPALYLVGADYADDHLLEQKRCDLVHSAAIVLEKCGLIKYDRMTGRFQSTELGRIASHYYITNTSMATYNEHLSPIVSEIDLFRTFALSDEFKYIPVRESEKQELAKLFERAPIPINESPEDPAAKINVLLQVYISHLKFEGFALAADMVYVTQSAGRITRALFEICLKRGWASATKLTLDLCKMVEKGQWLAMTPLRQFSECPKEVIHSLERKEGIPWNAYFELDAPAVTELLRSVKYGKLVHKLIHQFPRLELSANAQPITRSLLQVELNIRPNFTWEDSVHGQSEAFWIIVEDVDGEFILFHDQFILRKAYMEDEEDHKVDFTVPLPKNLPSNYFISVISDRWLHCETRIPLSFLHVILPAQFPPPTKLLDLQPLPIAALRHDDLLKLYQSFDHFNKIQTQVFNALFNQDENVFVGAPVGSGKTLCAELALYHHWLKSAPGRAVYIAPYEDIVSQRYKVWKQKFSDILGGKIVVEFTGELSQDLKLLEQGDLILATPVQWDSVSRRWQTRKNVRDVGLFIADDMHMVGGSVGPTYEIIISRMRYIAAQVENNIRMIALSVSLANAKDLGEWLGCTSHTIYNFAPETRPLPLETHIQSYSIPHFPSLMIAMSRPAYFAITSMSPDKPVMIFVPDRKQCRLTAEEILTLCSADEDENKFLSASLEEIEKYCSRVKDHILKGFLGKGVGCYHDALTAGDKQVVEDLYTLGAIKLLIVSREMCWSVPVLAHLVIIMGTQYFLGKEHRYIDYTISDLLQMLGRAGRPGVDETGRAVLMTQQIKKEYYRKFLTEPLPIESHLQHYLHDSFVSEITTKTIENKQDAIDWLTWTYFYRRLVQNPSFYNLEGTRHDQVNEFLSDLVETTCKDLSDAKLIAIEDEMDLLPLHSAMIAAYYNISWTTLHTFTLSFTARTKMRGLLEIISSATELADIPIRRHDDIILKKIHDRIPVKLAIRSFESPITKSFILLQAHFSRLQLPADLANDQGQIIIKAVRLLSACVDVMSSEGYVNAFHAMELSQMCVQAVWDRDSSLRQIPYFTDDVIKRCQNAGVYGVMDMEDEQRDTLLQMSTKELAEVANFVNQYPSIEMTFEIRDPEEIRADQSAVVVVHLERTIDEDEEVDTTVFAPHYPAKKNETWWLVISNDTELLGIKRVTLQRRLDVQLQFVVSNTGHQSYKLTCMSDSYIGADQELLVEFYAKEKVDENGHQGGEEEAMTE